jgi:DNA ligase-1
MVKPMRGVKPTTLNQFPYLVSPKIDGIRAIVKDGIVLSKTMKPLPCKKLHELFGNLHGADGELVVGIPNKQNATDDVFARSRGPIMQINGDADFKLVIFDRWDTPDVPAIERVKYSFDWKLPDVLDSFIFVPHCTVSNQDELDEYLSNCMTFGYEGAMLRHPNGRYKYGQSTEKEGYLLKLKPMATAEAIVIGYEEQYANTNEATIDELGHTKRSSAKAGKVPKGTFGAFLVRDLESGVEFSVGNGPGLTHALRDKLWAERSTLIGRYITYSYQEIGTKIAPRLPQFLHFRDATDISETVETNV